MNLRMSAGRAEILNPDGTIAVHSDMPQDELASALSLPDVPAEARFWGGLALDAQKKRASDPQDSSR